MRRAPRARWLGRLRARTRGRARGWDQDGRADGARIGHDVFSAWHPLWVGGPAHAQLGDELAARGLEYLNTDHPTGTLYPDGEAAFLLRTAEGNAQELGPEWPGVLQRFFPNADLAFGVLGTELWSSAGLAFGAK